MPAPTKHPDWATDATNNVEPPSGKIAAGWLPGEQPPSGWMNWWKNLVGQWTRWLEAEAGALGTRLTAAEGAITALDADHDALAADAALKSATNTFAREQTVQLPDASTAAAITLNAQRADAPLIASSSMPADHAAGNRWKLVGQFKRAGGSYAYLYVGADATNLGGFAIVVNARWDPGAQVWVREAANKPASAVVVRDSAVVVARKDWDGSMTWPHDGWGYGSLRAYDTVLGGEVKYDVAKTRTVAVNICNGWTNGTVSNGGQALRLASSGAQEALWPLHVPHGVTLKGVTYKADSPGPTTVRARLYRRHSLDYGSNTVGSYQQVDEATLTISGVALDANNELTLSFGDIVASSLEDYSLHCQNMGTADAYIRGVQFIYEDPGLATFGSR